jgi:hypothetical protein
MNMYLTVEDKNRDFYKHHINPYHKSKYSRARYIVHSKEMVKETHLCNATTHFSIINFNNGKVRHILCHEHLFFAKDIKSFKPD